MEARLSWTKGMQFECNNHGVISYLDASVEHGGGGEFASPKELLLNAMMGCTGIDVLMTLKKMRQEVEDLRIEVRAQQTDDYPVHFYSATLLYRMVGNIDEVKLKKAIKASLTQYCGISYMVSKTCKISYEIHLNDQLIARGTPEEYQIKTL